MTEDEFEVIETDTPFSNKIDYSMVLMRQVERINVFLSKLNETPPYVWAAYSKAENNFDPQDIKPNIDNFIFSIISLSILLEPYKDQTFVRFEKRMKKNEKLRKDRIRLARTRYAALMRLMSRKNLLPIQIID